MSFQITNLEQRGFNAITVNTNAFAPSEGIGMEGIGLKKDRNGKVKDLRVYLQSLYNPMMI